MTPKPVRTLPTAADRSAYRSPPIAWIIGKIGPDATPHRANRAIETGSDGTTIAPARATDRRVAQVVVNRTWSNRSAITEDTSRPMARPAQKSDSPRVAVLSGAGSRNRTSQLETPISEAT